MQSDTSSFVQRVRRRVRQTSQESQSPRRHRRFRRLPPAITPITARDLVAGIAGYRRGTGREAFQREIGSTLGADSTATYTSFRRALGACLGTMAEAARGDETDILIPAFCSSDYPDAIEGAGLTASRYDIDPESLSLDMDSLAALPTENALAVVVINVLGYGSEMDRIAAYCREHDIYLIEALGYAYGASYDSDHLGTFGDCSVLNFQQGKPIPIGGGMVVSRNSELQFSDEGRPAVDPNIGTMAGYAALSHPRPYACYSLATRWLEKLDAAPEDVSTHPESKFGVPYEPPFATLSNFHGTVGRRVLDHLPEHRRQRAETAEVYATELADCPHVRQLQPVAGLSNHQHVRYPLVVDDIEIRAEIRDGLAAVGVETAVLYDWPPLSADEFPGAAQLQDEIVTLPTHPYVDAADRQLIVDTVRDIAVSVGG
ncbi:hypothetical protein EGH24_11980 [Halonotius terrestris]|uniref:dTDP-4-amino-4,6-dideoxygalactose transaminase n=1 Tax=Halonotius terrestris TaxID=2487750 RepID=A0A8J8PAG5_9EURY|nr:DegT/DnrJ/EryC1/StrS family aminotransferase [Halonotius terrestris]TQQ79342.1 hypothetical protein EGH24_11980 [Halonotius terrestris]